MFFVCKMGWCRHIKMRRPLVLILSVAFLCGVGSPFYARVFCHSIKACVLTLMVLIFLQECERACLCASELMDLSGWTSPPVLTAEGGSSPVATSGRRNEWERECENCQQCYTKKNRNAQKCSSTLVLLQRLNYWPVIFFGYQQSSRIICTWTYISLVHESLRVSTTTTSVTFPDVSEAFKFSCHFR